MDGIEPKFPVLPTASKLALSCVHYTLSAFFQLLNTQPNQSPSAPGIAQNQEGLIDKSKGKSV